MKQNQQTERVCNAGLGDLVLISKSPLPGESHKIHLSPLATSFGNPCVSYQGSLYEHRGSGFLRVSHIGLLCLANSKIPYSQKEHKCSP